MQLTDLDGMTPHTVELTDDQVKLIQEFLDTDEGWDSCIVRISYTSDTAVEFTRIETYRRNP